jgi:hypothetical protein
MSSQLILFSRGILGFVLILFLDEISGLTLILFLTGRLGFALNRKNIILMLSINNKIITYI